MPPPSDPESPQRSDRSGDSVADQLWWYRDHRLSQPLVLPERRWVIRREHVLDALVCLTVSTLCFSQARSEILLRADHDFYNRIRLGAPTLLAPMVSLLAVAAVGFVSVQVTRRVPRLGWLRLGAVAAAASLLISLNFVRITHETLGEWIDAVGRPGLLTFVLLVLAASVAWPRPSLRVMRRFLLIVSPLAVLTLLHITWMFLEITAGPAWRDLSGEPLKQGAPSLRRVVWLVFDELDQRIAFEKRPSDLELPELDRLKRESLYADAARPPAGSTELSMPALITGRPVVAVAPGSPNDLDLTFADGKPASWSSFPNVFSRARALGYDTAVIGWQLPYPRVLGDALGAAAFRPSVVYEQARGASFTEAIWNQWDGLVPPMHVRRLLAQRVAELRDLAIRTASDGRFGLVLLHLPIPRTPGIYERATGRLTTRNFAAADQAYLDNLALADRVIGDLRRRLDRTRLDDRTWIVVSSVRGTPVPFLVRPPEGGRTVHVDAPFNTLATHDLVLGILRGSINDASEAANWLARWPVAPPKSYTREGRPIY